MLPRRVGINGVVLIDVNGCLSVHQNELNSPALICITLLILGYWTYNAPEISETIYNHLRHALYGEKPYVDNENLKKLVVVNVIKI